MTISLKRAVILDADWLIFKACSGAEIETNWGDGIFTLECDHNQAWSALHGHIESIMNKVQDRHPEDELYPVMCYTDDVNWRKSVLPTYKANRKETRKPTGYKHFMGRTYNYESFLSFLRATLEGDDCMGILATKPSLVGCEVATVVSCDKDFKTIPCEFYHQSVVPQNPHKWYELTESDADYWHMYQTIIGDTTDGYNGIKGYGSDTAMAFLSEPYAWEQYEHTFKSGARKGQTELRWRKVEQGDLTLWECMVTLAAKADMTEEELLVQAQVARICRASDYNFKSKEVILWKPMQNNSNS